MQVGVPSLLEAAFGPLPANQRQWARQLLLLPPPPAYALALHAIARLGGLGARRLHAWVLRGG